MFAFVRRALTAVRERTADDLLQDRAAEQTAVSEAIRIISEHLEQEARNRRLHELAPRDLCPDQKAALVKDLSRLLR
ncbi:MAG: hypothetical protein EPO21_17940 [Chloroflexota bacterium]|nr:MAG: hypothetical protein EPO21_17940 [Chloroflexota bacterium]